MPTTSLFAHSPEFHVPHQSDDSKPEAKQVEENFVNEKSEIKIQQTSSPEVENQQVEENPIGTQTQTVLEEKIINSVDFSPTTNLLPQPGEIVFFLLLTTPFLLFSLKRYIFR